MQPVEIHTYIHTYIRICTHTYLLEHVLFSDEFLPLSVRTPSSVQNARNMKAVFPDDKQNEFFQQLRQGSYGRKGGGEERGGEM